MYGLTRAPRSGFFAGRLIAPGLFHFRDLARGANLAGLAIFYLVCAYFWAQYWHVRQMFNKCKQMPHADVAWICEAPPSLRSIFPAGRGNTQLSAGFFPTRTFRPHEAIRFSVGFSATVLPLCRNARYFSCRGSGRMTVCKARVRRCSCLECAVCLSIGPAVGGPERWSSERNLLRLGLWMFATSAIWKSGCLLCYTPDYAI
jgi:hypothetical protein